MTFGSSLRTPSTEMIRSPGRSDSAAADPLVILSTRGSGSTKSNARKNRITNAIRRLTAGPAPITTIRFHTGWW